MKLKLIWSIQCYNCACCVCVTVALRLFYQLMGIMIIDCERMRESNCESTEQKIKESFAFLVTLHSLSPPPPHVLLTYEALSGSVVE